MAELRQDGFYIMCVEPEGSWVYEIIPAIVSTNKYVLRPDGVDCTTVIAEVDEGTEKVVFYDMRSEGVLAVVPVDEETRTATLEITGETEGVLPIRVGNKISIPVNEVLIVFNNEEAVPVE